MNTVQKCGFFLIYVVWVVVSFTILFYGVKGGAHGGGEVAMSMFVISLPSSLLVSYVVEYFVVSAGQYESWHIISIWMPYFLSGLAQVVLFRMVFLYVYRFCKNKM